MCLSVPARILKICNSTAQVSISGSIIEVSLQLLENVKIGDYVLVHAGFALEKLDTEEAIATLKTLEDLSEEDPEELLGYIEI